MLKKLFYAVVIIILAGPAVSALEMQKLSPMRTAAGQSSILPGTEDIPSDDSNTSFDPMYIFYGAKLAFSVLLAGTAITDPDSDVPERVIIGGAALLAGIPSYAVMHHARAGRKDELRKWRNISFAADLALSSGLIAYGVCSMGRGDISSQYTGLAALTAGTAGALLSTINLKKFRIETSAPVVKQQS